MRTGEDFEVVEGADPYGAVKHAKTEDGRLVIRETFDAEPLLDAAAADRKATAGQRWGEMRKVGTIPMTVYAKYMTIKDPKQRHTLLLNWLRANPAFVTFDKFLLR